jgi:hypothetical protein
MHAVPKVIHIIWLGGDIPQRNRDCIRSFPTLNPDWEVNLWIDANQLLTGERSRLIKEDKASPTSDDWKRVAQRLGKNAGDAETIKYLENYLKLRGEDLRGMRASKVNSIISFCEANGIKLREVQRDLILGKNSAIYRGELVNRGANFGSASDILRIEILLQYGGVYVDTDVRCVSALGEINCEPANPRFSAVHPVWKKGVSQINWESSVWWEQNIRGQEPPSISNSLIASHAGCYGLHSYKSLISKNFQSIKTSAEKKKEYLNDVRGSTIKMTGPTAAQVSTGFETLKTKMFNELDLNDPDGILQNKIYMRDHWYFPMYTIEDQYFHDWLPAST